MRIREAQFPRLRLGLGHRLSCLAPPFQERPRGRRTYGYPVCPSRPRPTPRESAQFLPGLSLGVLLEGLQWMGHGGVVGPAEPSRSPLCGCGLGLAASGSGLCSSPTSDGGGTWHLAPGTAGAQGERRGLEECCLLGMDMPLAPGWPLLCWEGCGSQRLMDLCSPESPPRNLDSRTFITIGDRVGAG